MLFSPVVSESTVLVFRHSQGIKPLITQSFSLVMKGLASSFSAGSEGTNTGGTGQAEMCERKRSTEKRVPRIQYLYTQRLTQRERVRLRESDSFERQRRSGRAALFGPVAETDDNRRVVGDRDDAHAGRHDALQRCLHTEETLCDQRG